MDNFQYHQQVWLNLQQQYPQLSKTSLRQLAPATYAWLYRHAFLWLQQNSPVHQQTNRPLSLQKERVDWSQRDLEVLDLVTTAVSSILSTNKLHRITISRVGKTIGLLALLEQHLDSLPKTREYLATVTETVEDF